MAKPALNKVKKSILEQLEKRGSSVAVFTSLVEDYCNLESSERKIWAHLNELEVGTEEWKEYTKLAQNAISRKMLVFKQLDIKTTNVISCDDEEM